MKKYDVFISYSSFDQKIVEGLCAFLEQKKIRCFVAYRDIPKGMPWPPYIPKALSESRMMVVVFSDNFNCSEEVDRELTIASKKKMPILTFRLSDEDFKGTKEYYLSNINWIDAFPNPENAFGDITESIVKLLDINVDSKKVSVREKSNINEISDELKKPIKLPTSTPTKKDEDEKPITIESKIIQANGVEFKMIKVDGGTFDMGAENSKYDESPVHKVTLSDYYMAETTVTQELWSAVMGNNPSCFKNNYFPVEEVSWIDCIEFIKKLNSITGIELRLPTEAEWEYAARGGKYSKGYIYSGSNNIEEVAWWAENSENTTHRVKTKLPNELGLYDMSGNVWEWCNDNSALYSKESVTNPQGPVVETSKVQRGGCWDGKWFADKDSCKVTYRSSDTKTYSSKRIGLRLAMSTSNTSRTKKTNTLPNIFKLTIANKDIHMLLSANKKYYIGNILDKDSKFKWLNANSGISLKDVILASSTFTSITTIAVMPIFSLWATILYWLFSSGKDKNNNDEVVVDENFCKAISGDYKFSIPNAAELNDVIESEKSHCFVLRLSENPKLKESLTILQ